MPRRLRALVPYLAVYLVATGVYLAVLGPERLSVHSPDNHYAHLADAWLRGRLDLPDGPPGTNDWACFDPRTGEACAGGFRARHDPNVRWYVSFPPFPAAVIAPAVAVFGRELPDRAFWALIAGLGPALLLAVLRKLGRAGHGERSLGEDLALTALFAFGSVFFFVAVQGTVWFAAHVVGTALLCGYLYATIDAERPVLAGTLLGLAFLTRPTTLLLSLVFAAEAARVSRREGAAAIEVDTHPMRRLGRYLAGTDVRGWLRRALPFALPIVACLALAAWHNDARYDDPTEFGHRFLQIRWRPRIERWGLFSYHYLGRNLSIWLTSLPWILDEAPWLRISRHGLALWVTTPALLWLGWPKRWTPLMIGLLVSSVPVVLMDLCYQNSGWVQFGPRFALDYLPLWFAALALGGRRFRVGFAALFIWALAINAFGAATFDRAWEHYDGDGTQRVLTQPD